MTRHMSTAQKFAWLVKHLPNQWIENIYRVKGFTPNGCGPDSWQHSRLPKWALKLIHQLLNHPLGLPCLDPAGDWHDWLYWIGGNEETRLYADKELRRLLSRTVDFSWTLCGAVRWARMQAIAWGYYLAVRKFGGKHYNYEGSER